MAQFTFDSRGLIMPAFDQGFLFGRASLMNLRFICRNMNLAIDDDVAIYGKVPEGEVWRILRFFNHDAGPVAFKTLRIWLRLGNYESELVEGQLNEGPLEAFDSAWIRVWFNATKFGGSGIRWWRITDGSYGADLRYLLPRDSFHTWVVDDDQSAQEYVKVPNLALSIWPAGAEWWIESANAVTADATYSQDVNLMVLRLKEADVRAVNPLTIEGLG